MGAALTRSRPRVRHASLGGRFFASAAVVAGKRPVPFQKPTGPAANRQRCDGFFCRSMGTRAFSVVFSMATVCGAISGARLFSKQFRNRSFFRMSTNRRPAPGAQAAREPREDSSIQVLHPADPTLNSECASVHCAARLSAISGPDPCKKSSGRIRLLVACTPLAPGHAGDPSTRWPRDALSRRFFAIGNSSPSLTPSHRA